MKTNNKKKIVVSTLALAMGAALAGSVSGSVAWYQYSTRSVAEFTGVAAHCTENLQIRVREDSTSYTVYDEGASKLFTYTKATGKWGEGVTIPAAKQYNDMEEAEAARDAQPATISVNDYCTIDSKPYQLVTGDPKNVFKAVPSAADEDGRNAFLKNFDWNSDLRSEAIEQYLTFVGRSSANTLVPVTAKAGFDGNRDVAEHLYREPVYQEASVLREADADDFISLPLEIRVLDNDGTKSKTLAQDIHVTDVAMEAVRGDQHKDVTEALRLGIESKVNGEIGRKVTLSKDGTDVKGYGTLDLNNNGEDDRAHGYSWQNRETIIYGLGDQYITVESTDIIKTGVDTYVKASDFSAATITTYANLAARKAADETVAPSNNALCYITSLDTYYKFDGSSWVVFEDVKVSETGVVKKDTSFYNVPGGTAATVPATQVVFEGDYIKAEADKYFSVGASTFSAVEFPAWEATHSYTAGALVSNSTKFYKAKAAFTSGASFDETEAAKWEKITPIDVIGKQVKLGDKIYKYSESTYSAVDLNKAENLIKSKSVANFISHETSVGVFDNEKGLLGTTTDTNNLDVNLKIYLEGWDLLSGEDATWDSKTIGAQFNLGITFATTLHDDSHD